MPTALHHLLLERKRHWLTMAELAEYGRFPSVDSVRKWIDRHAPELKHYRGRRVLVDREAFDRYVLEHGLLRSA